MARSKHRQHYKIEGCTLPPVRDPSPSGPYLCWVEELIRSVNQRSASTYNLSVLTCNDRSSVNSNSEFDTFTCDRGQDLFTGCHYSQCHVTYSLCVTIYGNGKTSTTHVRIPNILHLENEEEKLNWQKITSKNFKFRS